MAQTATSAAHLTPKLWDKILSPALVKRGSIPVFTKYTGLAEGPEESDGQFEVVNGALRRAAKPANTSNAAWLNLALLNVGNHAIAAEAAAIFFGRNTFSATCRADWTYLVLFLCNIGDKRLHLQNLQVMMYHPLAWRRSADGRLDFNTQGHPASILGFKQMICEPAQRPPVVGFVDTFGSSVDVAFKLLSRARSTAARVTVVCCRWASIPELFVSPPGPGQTLAIRYWGVTLAIERLQQHHNSKLNADVAIDVVYKGRCDKDNFTAKRSRIEAIFEILETTQIDLVDELFGKAPWLIEYTVRKKKGSGLVTRKAEARPQQSADAAA